MKKLACCLMFLCLMSCKTKSTEMTNLINGINERLIERSYTCAEMGYRYAAFGFSKEKMFKDLEEIIGKRPKNIAKSKLEEKK